jgi:hypothetical protein
MPDGIRPERRAPPFALKGSLAPPARKGANVRPGFLAQRFLVRASAMWVTLGRPRQLLSQLDHLDGR